MPLVSAYLGDKTGWTLDSILSDRLDLINYAFALVNAEGEVFMPTPTRVKEISKAKAKNPNLKILLSIGGWGADGFSQASSTQAGRELFAQSAVEIMQSANLDGLDIDWEYPTIPAAGIAACPEDTENFTKLLKTLRTTLTKTNPKSLLTIAVGASGKVLDKINFPDIHPILDYINVMTYDMRGYEPTTGHHTNLFSAIFDKNDPSADWSVNHLIQKGVPREKLIIGAAFYGRTWENVPNIGTGLRVIGGQPAKTMSYKQIEATWQESFERHFDIYCKAPYFFNGEKFITCDDPESLTHKARYTIEKGLGGVMFWEYSLDTEAHDLLIALSEAMRK